MDINSFLPAYPSILKSDEVFDLFPSGFYQSIQAKKEFSQLTTYPSKPQERKVGVFQPQNHQILESRYASAETPYEAQLIIHSMGTGKTALAVLTVENNLKKGFVGGVIALPSKKFIKSFVTEIVNITGVKYLPDKHKEMTPEELERGIKSKIKKTYKFITFEAFANGIKADKEAGGLTAVRLRNEYSNRVIIVDEAHNLRIQPDKRAATSRVNNAFSLLFHSVYNCKILLMTGTPMKDRWNEIADLANLILPLSNQLPTGENFNKEFENDGKTIKNTDRLKEALKGIVSTFRTIPSDVNRKFVGEKIAGLELFNVDVSKMSQFQEEAYLKALAEDSSSATKEGIYDASRQAINFVFPDGSYGKDGFKKYTIALPVKKGREKKGMKSYEVERITPALRNLIVGKTTEETLKNLSKYSSKYAETIKDILKGGNTYIYNSFVGGSGAIIFARMLELFGYTRSVKGLENTVGKRYVILTNRTIDEQGTIVANTQKTFNDPKNAKGEYIQVIIGSRTSGEGLSFYNVENIGVHTPYWNYSTIDQAVARGIRYLSHDVIREIFKKEGKEFIVKIHHYVAVPKDPEESIDVMMYKRSEDKDIRIKLGERLLKEISYDCGINRLVNMKGLAGTRDCDYVECNYKCEGITDYNPVPDVSSYNYFYSSEEEGNIISLVKKMYQTTFSLTLEELKRRLRSPDDIPYHPFVVLKTLKRMTDQSEIIINKFGFKSFLREHNDVYFLVDSMDKPSSFLSAYYTSAPAVKEVRLLNDYIDDINFEEAGLLLDLICQESERSNNFDKVYGYIKRLPITIQEFLLENLINADEKKVQEKAAFRKWFLDLNSANIHRFGDQIVSTLVEDTVMCRSPEGVWTDCSIDEKVLKDLEEKKAQNVKGLEENPYGYYAVVNKKLLKENLGWKKGFWIRSVIRAKKADVTDRRRNIRGDHCGDGTMSVGQLASIAFTFGIDIDNGVDVKKKLPEIVSILKNNKPISAELVIDSLSEADNRRLFRLYKATAKVLCTVLLEWFQTHDLVEITTKETMK